MRQQLTKAMIRELRSIEWTGNPSDPIDWHGAGGLWFHARDKVIGALLRRGLIVDDGCFRLTEQGKAAIQ